MDRRQVWRATLGELEISLSQATFETWFRRTALLRVDEQSSTFTLGVASGFAKDWIEERYRSLIAQTIAKIVGYSVTLQVEVVSEDELDAQAIRQEKDNETIHSEFQRKEQNFEKEVEYHNLRVKKAREEIEFTQRKYDKLEEQFRDEVEKN